MKVYSRMQMIIQAAVFFSVGLTAAWDKEDEPADVHLDLAAEDLYLVTDPPVPRERREADDLELGSGDELTTQAPSYPTQPPITEGAVYTFTVDFKITNMNLTDFNDTMEQSFIDVVCSERSSSHPLLKSRVS
ncbi:uncharacterized protein LOC125372425 [Haliotis rufescens]|uniref:uncharacterized protein LOC125372425 n=1 Tax=Haliotis rufescens TaxID=6454 RepID=UPI00201EDB42|nr:uncharacterized protein LOC125372425 [Haliotis rufescens]